MELSDIDGLNTNNNKIINHPTKTTSKYNSNILSNVFAIESND